MTSLIQVLSNQMVIKTDKAILVVVFTTFLTFLLLFLIPIRSIGIGAIWWLYPNLLLAICWFGYLIIYQKELTDVDSSRLLFNSVLFGLATTATFLPMDRLFSRHGKLQFIIYRSTDFFGNIMTPVGIILTWVLFATLLIYCFHRLDMIGVHRLLASTIIGVIAAIGSIVVYRMGEDLWIWNSLRIDNMFNILTVPIFVPITFLLTFLLCPYYFHRQQHPLVAGMRCGLFMGVVMFLSYIILWRSMSV